PGIIAAVKDGRPVYAVEGEKDVLALEAAGLVATCNPGGAGKWRKDYCKPLRGVGVIVIADRDTVGWRHAQQVATALNGVAGCVRVIGCPDVEGKTCKDASDYFEAGGGAADLDELAQAAPIWTPSAHTPTATQEAPARARTNSLAAEYGFVEAEAEAEPAKSLTIRAPDEILAMDFDDSDIILGDRLLALGQSLVMAGAGGV